MSALRKAHASSLSKPPAMTFGVFDDNGGDHWRIVADGGETLMQSTRFASYDQAKQAARIVQHCAAQASFEDRAEDRPEGHAKDTPSVDLPARRDARTARDRSGAACWFDKDGSFSSEAVMR